MASSTSIVATFTSFILIIIAISSVADGFPAESIPPIVSSKSPSCRFKSDLSTEFIPEFSNKNGAPLLPRRQFEDDDGTWSSEIFLEANRQFNVRCLGRGNSLRHFGTKTLSVSCGPDGNLQTEFGLTTFDELVCTSPRAATAVRNGTCNNNNSKVTKIDVNLSENNGATYYWVCHDEATSETLYVTSIINGPLLDQSESINRPSFQEAGFYPDMSVDNCYTQVEQTATVADLLESQTLAEQYIQPSKNLFFARGHLMPNGDGIYAHEKRATYYFVNVVPQWQTFNGGNWERLESAARAYAGAKNVVLNVITGAWGVTTLKNGDGDDVEIYLGKDSAGNPLKKLPAPRLMWKVLHDPVAKSAVAIIQINNPYEENHLESDKNLCPDQCDNLSWVTWDTVNARLGSTFCCDVASFSKALPNAPDLGSLPLLDY